MEFELDSLLNAAARVVDLANAKSAGIFTSNCDCGDNDGCDGDCGGDGSEGC